ncbi:MAG: hypothetical protein M3O76_05260 [Actinomycetota bacterium]|nr:hypothetical protein [Actinomycetota bacterium]
MTTTHDVWTDPELRELLLQQPELVAIADALAQAEVEAATRRSRRRVPRNSRILAVAAALAAVVAVALIAPWTRSGGSLSDLALAAIGSQPVLHVIAESEVPTGGQLIDIKTGRVQQISQQQQEETWYDAAKGLKRDTVRVDSTIVDDTLETPQGGYTPGGIIYDCAWIAAHPIQATRARVSCNFSGDNGTTPHVVPRPKPTLDPGLAGFVDGYRQALATGRAREDGSGRLDGRPVDWLAFETSDGSERVALDHTTHKPVLLENDSGWRLRITSIETIPFAAADFRRPTVDEVPAQPSFGGAADAQTLQLERGAIAAAVPGAVWAGLSVNGLALAKAERQLLRTTFANHARPPQTGAGLELEYGTLDASGRLDASHPYLRIQGAPSRALAFGNMWGFVRGDDPPDGRLYTSGSVPVGFTVVGDTYVTIQASSADLLLAAASALEPAR